MDTTVYLEEQIARAVEAHNEQLRAARAAKEAEETERRRQREAVEAEKIAALQAIVDEELPRELQQALHLRIVDPSTDAWTALSIVADGGTIPIARYANQSAYWTIRPPWVPNAQAERGGLQELILVTIARIRKERAKHEEHARQRAETEAAQQAEHERCEARIAEATINAQRELWQWPEGREITLYHWQWQCGRNEDGSPYWDDTWATTNRLSDDGELITGSGKRLTIFPLANHPVAEARTFAGVAALPGELKRTERIAVEGIADVSDWGEPARYAEQAGGVVYVEVGSVPAEWVRALIDGK